MPGARVTAAAPAQGVAFPIARSGEARGILTRTSGFLVEAGFTHSLTPARNCLFGCTYCYVPTMRVYAGLKREDWERWGQFTTLKDNAAELLRRELRPHQVIYCSPLVDPYQPAEESAGLMPRILEAVAQRPPAAFVVQTRGPLIVRDIAALRRAAAVTRLRISMSLTTDDDRVRRLYEPHCATLEQRLVAIRELRDAGLAVFATLAPLLPSDPERLACLAIEASARDLVGDPLHVRQAKPRGATTRDAAFRIARAHHHEAWFEPEFQNEVEARIRRVASTAGLRFETGPKGFACLTR